MTWITLRPLALPLALCRLGTTRAIVTKITPKSLIAAAHVLYLRDPRKANPRLGSRAISWSDLLGVVVWLTWGSATEIGLILPPRRSPCPRAVCNFCTQRSFFSHAEFGRFRLSPSLRKTRPPLRKVVAGKRYLFPANLDGIGGK